MRIAAACMVVAILIIGGVIIVRLWRESNSLSESAASASAMMAKDQSVESGLSAQLDYLSHPENVAKELRARFNLHLPGEHTIIIVNPSSSSSQ